MAGEEPPGDALRERVAGRRPTFWLLLDADRRVVSGLLLATVFAAFLALGYLWPAADAAIRSSDSVDTLFQGLLTATITSVTLVLTLNQLVLSQELGAVGDQRERMEGALTFRDDVAQAIDAPVSPARPSQHLRALVQVAGERARDLRSAASGIDTENEAHATTVEDFADGVIENADQVAASLDGAQFGTFDVLSAALDFNYSWKIFTAKRLRADHADALDDAATTALDDLLAVLELFGPAREHVKTLYFQWDLVDLSRRMLAAAIPALVVAGAMIAFFDAPTYHVAVGGVQTLVLVLALAATLSILPFAILLAYMLRIATVAKQTLAIGPFILREADDLEGVEWNR